MLVSGFVILEFFSYFVLTSNCTRYTNQPTNPYIHQMMTFNTPLLCGDEISTGLDTASTVDILRILSYLGRLLNRVTVVSLLQPSPEAVSLFDEIILLSAGGHVIYTGPAGEAVGYFRDMGYVQPDGMDDADYLLAVASSDRKHLFRPDLVGEEREKEKENVNEDGSTEKEKEEEKEEVAPSSIPAKNAFTTNAQQTKPDTPESFAEKFQQSKDGLKIAARQQQPWKHDWSKGDIGTTTNGEPYDIESFKQKYQNSFMTSVWLNMKRSFILWTRDRTYIRASAIKNVSGAVVDLFATCRSIPRLKHLCINFDNCYPPLNRLPWGCRLER